MPSGKENKPLYKTRAQTGVVLQASNYSPGDAEAGGLQQVQGYPKLHSELKANLSYIAMPSQKPKKVKGVLG